MNRYKNKLQKLRVSSAFYFSLLTFNLFLSFTPAEDCKVLISNAIKKINQLESTAKDKGFYMEYTVTSDFTFEGKLKTMKESFKIKLKDDRSFVSGSSADIYKDSHSQVAIMKQEQTIFIAGPGDERFSRQKMQNMVLLQDSTLKKSKIASCADVVLGDKRKYKQVEMIASEEMKKQMGLKKITFWIDALQVTMKKMKFISLKEGFESKLELDINKADYNYQGPVFEGTALSKALTPEGNLLPAFKNYRLVDARVKAKVKSEK